MSLQSVNDGFDRFFDMYRREGKGFYEALNAICTQIPYHRDLSSSLAKVAIIGEMYRTNARPAIDRSAFEEYEDEDCWRILARHFVEIGEELDNALNGLRNLTEPFSPEDYVLMAKNVLKIQEYSQQVAKRRRSDNKPHSLLVFASKYAQAHAPSVVVIDDIAESAAWSFAPYILANTDPWETPVGEALKTVWQEGDRGMERDLRPENSSKFG